MSKPIPRVVYTPDPQIRQPRQFLRAMTADLGASRELAIRLMLRNLRARYRQSLLGFLWAIIPAMATTFVWVFLNAAEIINVGQTDIPYPLYVLSGTILWQLFVDALNSPFEQLAGSRSLLIKINFPREALILAGLGEVFFNFGIRFCLLIVVFLLYQEPVPWTIILAPIGVLSLAALGTVFALILVPFGMLYQDIRQALSVVTLFWFFVTPIVYPVPTTWPAALVAALNPVTPLLVTTRELLTTGTVSRPGWFLTTAGISFFALFFAWILYRVAMPHLVERLSE